MATWAVGDLQGCRPEFERLLDRIAFEPASDRLWLCGDLVNRGGESLAVLRLLHSIRDSVTVTLGNHDLSLLAISLRDEASQARVNPDLREVLFASDHATLLDWLRGCPLLHHDQERDVCMIHAGLAPRWSIGQARHEARTVERALQGPAHRKLLSHMFGNKPARWTPSLRGVDRQRASINVLTRMRYCDVQGRIDFQAKGPPGTQRAGLYPWFAVPGMKQRSTRIICGHWSALDRFAGLGIYALDTGCVWGGKLTALCLDEDEPRYVTVDAGPNRKPAP
ncbi:MAG: symmetrical bis(5'-nucleosyl)-tetraphosphatase [Rhodanobacteraceae bacterium]